MIKMSEIGKGKSENQKNKEEELRNLFLGIMEGYTDSAIPPLSYFSTPEIPKNEESSSSSRKRQKDESERTQSERRRRDQLTGNFSLLTSMVPSLVNDFKPSKEKILVDTVNYIKHLQQETERLENLKKSQSQSKVQKVVERHSLSKCGNHSSVNVTISDSATFLVIQLPSRRGSALEILRVLEKHKAEVMEARIDVNDEKVKTFTATVSFGSDGGSSIDKMRQDILTSLY